MKSVSEALVPRMADYVFTAATTTSCVFSYTENRNKLKQLKGASQAV